MTAQVLRTKYTMQEGIDYTDAVVRLVDGRDIAIRVGGFKAGEKHYAFLIEEAELQAGIKVNGSR